MPANELDAIEGRAAFTVAKKISGDVLAEAMEALFNAGVRDLSQATPDQFDQAADALVVNGVMPERVKACVTAFGKDVRDQLASNEAPF